MINQPFLIDLNQQKYVFSYLCISMLKNNSAKQKDT